MRLCASLCSCVDAQSSISTPGRGSAGGQIAHATSDNSDVLGTLSCAWKSERQDDGMMAGRWPCRAERGRRTTHGLDEVLQTQLDGEGCLSHTTIAQYHNLVWCGKSRCHDWDRRLEVEDGAREVCEGGRMTGQVRPLLSCRSEQRVDFRAATRRIEKTQRRMSEEARGSQEQIG